METKHWLILLAPLGVLAALMLGQGGKKDGSPSSGKEEYYLRFNKDEIFKNLIATEEHFRNVEQVGIDREGFLNCCVKHLASAEGHADEAVSHSLIADTEESSKKFRELRDEIRNLRYDLQTGTVSPESGIKGVRGIRRRFESFNPDFDISKCEACEIKVEIIKPVVI